MKIIINNDPQEVSPANAGPQTTSGPQTKLVPEIKKADAVFEGGGVKGIGLIGAVLYAEELGYQWQRLAGTSAGAIVASLLAAGYKAVEIKDLFLELDYHMFKDPATIINVPLISPLFGIMCYQGLYLGNKFENWLRQVLARKGVRKFGDLVFQDPNVPERSRLQVIASDLSRGRMMVLPDDLVDYGYKPDHFDVAKAVRMSISIPYYFRPVKISYVKDGSIRHSYVVDGGLLSNYPIWLFDNQVGPRWPTFGFRLVEPGYRQPNPIYGPVTLFAAMFSTMLEAQDDRHIRYSNLSRTIQIPTAGIQTTEFGLELDRRKRLFKAGYNAAEKFFANWRWQDYLRAHPSFWRETRR